MKFGLVGYPLGHSWSKEIHSHFIEHPYNMYELKEEELKNFIASKDFDGLNVTIPYKQEVMKYIDELDSSAKHIGAINCIVNTHGKLKGYNTDYIGFKEMLIKNNVVVNGKNVAILGTGGASKAVSLAIEDLGGKVTLVSRNHKEGVIVYEDLYQNESKYQIIVNTTPVGMSPRNDETPIDIHQFTNVEVVIDIIANPLRTRLLFEAKTLGLRTLGGFEMLVRQAFAADELFMNQKLDETRVPNVIKDILNKRKNIVFIGMPTAGKTTISQQFAKTVSKPVYEMDDEIVERLAMSIAQCFKEKGESYFRNIETDVARSHREAEGAIISCGGGVVKIEETMRYLSENGIIVWIKRNLDHLYPTDSRPLSSNEAAIKKMYEERLPLYTKYADVQVENNGTKEQTIQEILKKI